MSIKRVVFPTCLLPVITDDIAYPPSEIIIGGNYIGWIEFACSGKCPRNAVTPGWIDGCIRACSTNNKLSQKTIVAFEIICHLVITRNSG